jgi:adenine C2-methylase RlmN of 23S rRNA A2503 and tRNA A37
MSYQSREDKIKNLFPNEPKFRIEQIEKNLFNKDIRSFSEMSNIPLSMRETLSTNLDFTSYKLTLIQNSSKFDTYKATLKVEGPESKDIETVLMKNKRGQWTICVSSQVGCAMKCTFCATGKMGLIKSLHFDEILDQYRFWMYFLTENPQLNQRISNIVFMGMGEPLANYPNVKTTLNKLLKYTDLGITKITVSTVGVIPALNKILNDEEWPHVRLALSLHSADQDSRKEIVPTSFESFLEQIEEWAIKYLEKFGNNKHHLTFEYVMLKGKNDTKMHAEKLANFVNKIGNVKVNLIPYNFIGSEYECSTAEQILQFMNKLEHTGVKVTKRKNMGTDIDAACGQLSTKNSTRPN